jgi:hypothetical protein
MSPAIVQLLLKQSGTELPKECAASVALTLTETSMWLVGGERVGNGVGEKGVGEERW